MKQILFKSKHFYIKWKGKIPALDTEEKRKIEERLRRVRHIE